MLDSRAIALVGVGYSSRVLALDGLHPIGAQPPAVVGVGGYLAPPRRRPRPEPEPVYGWADTEQPGQRCAAVGGVAWPAVGPEPPRPPAPPVAAVCESASPRHAERIAARARAEATTMSATAVHAQTAGGVAFRRRDPGVRDSVRATVTDWRRGSRGARRGR